RRYSGRQPIWRRSSNSSRTISIINGCIQAWKDGCHLPKWYGRHWIFLRTDGSPTVAASTRHPLRHDFRNSPTTGRNNAVYGAAVRFEVRNVDFEVEAVVSLAHVTGKLTIEERDGSLKPTAGLQLN